jgi:hypothetical protein
MPTSLGENSFTNAGALLEMVLKGFCVAAYVQGRGGEFGAKNCEVLFMFSFSSKLSHLNAS